MNIANWITIAIALLTGINGWCQFLVKERVLTERDSAGEPLLVVARSRLGVVIIGVTGIIGLASAGLLAREVLLPEPLTRLSCFFIALLCILVPLNLYLVATLLTLRRLAWLAKEIRQSEQRSRDMVTAWTFMFMGR